MSPGESLAHARDLRLEPFQRALLREEAEARQADGARERVAGVGVAVEEGAVLLVACEERREDVLGGECRRQR